MRMVVRLVIVLAVLALIVAVGVSFAGVMQVPVLSGVFGTNAPRDLGEPAPNQAGYDAIVAVYGIEMPSPEENYTFASKHTFSGSVDVNQTFTEGEVMAIREMGNPAPGISDVHVRFHDGSAEVAAMVDLAAWGYPLSGPVYGTWSVEVTGPQALSVSIASLEFGRVPVPSDLAAQAENAINSYLSSRLPQVDGLAIESLELREGGIHYTGSLPLTYEAEPPAAGQLP
ncbi:MAG TPA: hypothetical protein VES19_03445 [Candidatus Limnocylindrales bacterium]|nr:hypothetical protein [Candidatus Limnocylindrales bacterium]